MEKYTCDYIGNTEQFWIEVHSFKKLLDDNPFTLVINLLSFPFSNTEFEICFNIF